MEYLHKLKELDMPDDDRMVFDNVAWQVGSMVFCTPEGGAYPIFKV